MGKKYTVLIVDDRTDNRFLLQTIITNVGYNVLEAANGKEGLKIARSHKPDFIISDVLMPEMDGFQFCREVKKDEELKDIPFVFCTATYRDQKDEAFGLSLGAEKYLIQPVETEELLNLIEQVIEKYKKGAFAAPEKIIEDEKEVFKLYSERLVNKLEKKMLDLEKEITGRKKAERRLQASEEKYRSMMESMRDEVHTEPTIFVGRGTHLILPRHTILSVHLICSRKRRIERLSKLKSKCGFLPIYDEKIMYTGIIL